MSERATRPDTREALLQAATELFLRQGYSATGIDEICLRAGVSKGALFHHFPDKEALGRAALERWVADAGRAFAGAPYGALADPLARLLGFVDFLSALARIGPPGCLVGIFTQELAPANEAVRATCVASFGSWIAHAESLIAAAKAVRAPASAIDPRSLAEHGLAVLQGALILARARGSSAVIEDQLGHYRRYLEACFGATPGAAPPRPARRARPAHAAP
jgi:TetR/AcrR family transcriptional repressor of nem operon